MRRCIGLDVHRELAQVAIWEDGVIWQAGRIQTTPEALRDFADSLCAADEVALERPATPLRSRGCWSARSARWWSPTPRRPGRSPRPRSPPTRSTRRSWRGCWRPTTCPRCGCPTTKPPRCAARSPAAPASCGSGPGCRNQVQSILHRNLVPRWLAADLFGHKGRAWLAAQDLPPDEHQAVGALGRQLDFHGQELGIVDAELGRVGLGRAEVRRLLTIPGVDATVALAIVAAVGDLGRFSSPQRLVSYLGLNPRLRQSGGQPAQHGRITTQGRAHARGMLVEAAWAAAKTPGPLRAFYERVRARRGMGGRRGGHRPQARHPVLAPGGRRAGRCLRAALAHRQAGSGRWSCAPACRPGAGARAPRPPLPARRSADASGRSPSRPRSPTASSSPAGNPSGQRPSPK
jgi:transposase